MAAAVMVPLIVSPESLETLCQRPNMRRKGHCAHQSETLGRQLPDDNLFCPVRISISEREWTPKAVLTALPTLPLLTGKTDLPL